MSRAKTALLLLALALGGCARLGAGAEASSAARTADINVFAAASLAGPFTEIGRRFEADHPGVTVVFNFAGSQRLAQQISAGAPADVFASASPQQMDLAAAAGGVAAGGPVVFARNRLVVIYPAGNPAGLAALADLARPGLKLVLAAPEVPAGRYALEFLDRAAADPAYGPGFRQGVLDNVVSYEENVSAAVAKVALGEADAGIAYASDLAGPEPGRPGWLEIPAALNVTAAYPIAALQSSRRPDLAQDFIALVLSPQGQQVLSEHLFVPAAAPTAGGG